MLWVSGYDGKAEWTDGNQSTKYFGIGGDVRLIDNQQTRQCTPWAMILVPSGLDVGGLGLPSLFFIPNTWAS